MFQRYMEKEYQNAKNIYTKIQKSGTPSMSGSYGGRLLKISKSAAIVKSKSALFVEAICGTHSSSFWTFHTDSQ